MLKTIGHSYACKIIREKKIRVFRDGKEILDQLYPHSYNKLTTHIMMGYNYSKEFIGTSSIKKSIDYDYLKSLGWKVTSRYAPSEFIDRQRVAYELVQADSIKSDYGSVPKKHNFEVDLTNQLIKFNGDNVSVTGTTGWMPLNPKRNRLVEEDITPFQISRIHSKATDFFNDNLPEELRASKGEDWFPIPEAVFGITEKGEICCIEKTEEPPRISVSGQSGSGKTSLLNNSECQFYYKFGWNIMNINDIKGDTQTRCLPWDKYRDIKFIKDLSRFKESTMPMPYLYLHPATKNLKNEDIFYKDEVGFEISFPLRKFIMDTNLMKYNANWSVSDRARKFIINLIEDEKGNERPDGLLHMDDLDSIKELIYGTEGKEGAIPKKMQDTLGQSIFHLMKDVWNRRILDNSTKINSNWTATIKGREYTYPPWDICLLCHICPSIITKKARTQDWFAIWIKHLLEDVFEFSSSRDYKLLQGTNIMLSGDELKQILTTKETLEVTDKIIREGRTENVGFSVSNQFFSDTPESIITNLTHYFVFKTQADSDISFFKKEFKLSNTLQNELRSLEKFQCFAFGDFILYDSNGNRYSNDNKPVKIIRIKPPNAQNYWSSRWLEKKGGKKNAESSD